MFYICEGNPKSPLPVPAELVRDKLHPEHVRFVADGVEKGVIIFGGPKTGTGGFILLKAPSMEDCRAFLNNDPMVVAGAQDYRITEFRIIEHHPCLDQILAEEQDRS